MAKKNECYLCGGKLRDGYCPDCGLDNTKIHGKHYHLNESYAVESMNGDSGKASEKCEIKTGQEERDENSFRKEEKRQQKKNISQKDKNKSQNTDRYQFQSMKKVRNTGRTGISVSKGMKMAVAVIVLSAVVIGLIGEYTFDQVTLFSEQEEKEPEALYHDPYEYVEKELAKTGEHYEVELEQGEYLVGVHFPEGNYTARLLEGRGGLSVDDFENGIYLWQSFGTDEEYDEVEYMEDIRLYKGARLEINDAVLLRLTTENGQVESMESIENPLTEAFTLKKDKTMVVGEDIPSGVYDLHVMFNWAILRCRIPDDMYEEGYYENSYWLGGEDWGDTYRNVYLKEGMEITAEENTLELTPSKEIGSGDYSDYYKYY